MEDAADRKIIFSSFDPDVATLCRLKQPRYPVFFLTCAGTKAYRRAPLPAVHQVHGSHPAGSASCHGYSAGLGCLPSKEGPDGPRLAEGVPSRLAAAGRGSLAAS